MTSELAEQSHALIGAVTAGFAEWGRLPDVIEVGDERFDDVRMYLKLGTPEHLLLRGSRPAGPGSSPRGPRPPRS